MKKLLLMILGLSLFILCGCSSEEKVKHCKYEKKSGLWEQEILDELVKDKEFQAWIDENSVEVEKQVFHTYGYKFIFRTYFYDEVSGLTMAKMDVKKDNGNELTKEDFHKINKRVENMDLSFYFEGTSSGAEIFEKTFRKEDGSGCLVIAHLNGGLICEDTPENLQTHPLTEMSVYSDDADGECVGRVVLPDYKADNYFVDKVEDQAEHIIDFKISNYGLSIVWDITEINLKFNEKLEQERKKLGAEFCEENYGITVYNEIKIKMKDGTIYSCFAKDNITRQCSEDAYDLNNLHEVKILFNQKMNVEEVESIIIDNTEYPLIRE